MLLLPLCCRSSEPRSCPPFANFFAFFFIFQFENEANFEAHRLGTGPELWRQRPGGGRLHAFVCAAGTGGSLAGVGAALRSRDPAVRLYLVDPPGSGLYNRVTRGVLYSPQEADGTRRAHPADTHLEGVGTNRLTANFGRCPRLDGAFRATDEEAVAMSRHLLAAEGLWVGGSAALNAVGAVRVAQLLGPGHTVATLLCDGGGRHVSKLWDEGWLKGAGLEGAAGKGLGWLLAQGGKKEEAARDG